MPSWVMDAAGGDLQLLQARALPRAIHPGISTQLGKLLSPYKVIQDR